MKIKSAKYWKDTNATNNSAILVVEERTNIVWTVPIDNTNTDYQEIKRQVDAGTLTIADAD